MTTFNLSLNRITAKHSINCNVWGHQSFQASFPKTVVFEGNFSELKGVSSNNVLLAVAFKNASGYLAGSEVKGFIVGNEIRTQGKGHVLHECYKGEALEVIITDVKGKVLHRQPFTKNVTVKDYGRKA